jgi:NAD(P)-dependent dehydrogenase (short-subunit alcohol dehydrogenase family)
VTARDHSRLVDLVAMAPEKVLALALDVTDASQIASAIADTQSRFGAIDVLVNNAGHGLIGALEELDDDELRLQFETNLFGALALVRAVLPSMRRQRSGWIVQISSVMGVIPEPGASAYVGSKFALEGMSESLAAEVAPLGIRVIIVEPGAFRTDFLGRSLRSSNPISDYEPLMAPTHDEIRAIDGSQPGDPYKAGEAIITALERHEPPLRLPLGDDAFTSIRPYLRARLEQLDNLEPPGADTAR